MNKKISWWQPKIGQLEYELVKQVLDSAFLNDGDYTTAFEERLAKLLGCPFVVAVTSCTTALYLCLTALDIGAGDEVIVPDLTFIATANAVTMAGAKPVLVDVDPSTLTMSPASFKQAITGKTKAVIPVHVSGRAADMPAISEIAGERKIHVIEDAAEALMSFAGGQALGTLGKFGCFSFSPNKTITTGQGGAIALHDERLHVRLRELKDQGRKARGTGGDDEHPAIGFNFKFTNLQAAVGLGQLDYLDQRLKRMKEIYLVYRQELMGASDIQLLPFSVDKGESPQWIDAIVKERDTLDNHLKERDIHCRKLWHPIHSQAPYLGNDNDFPNSTGIAKQVIWLPSDFSLTDADIRYVCTEIKQFALNRLSKQP